MVDWPSARILMSPEEFRILRDLVQTHCGIYFQNDQQYLFTRRLDSRLKELGLQDYTEYHRHLRYAEDRRLEMERLVELLTTNETYFFREEYQLKAFSEEILPDLILRRASHRRLRIWSAGCSTGEEVYTLAMLLLENPQLEGWSLEVFGNDISRKVLQTARKGVYGKSAMRVIEPYFLRKYFRKEGDRYRVVDEVRDIVSFGQLNLLDTDMLELLGPVSVVFCRNVLIYFDRDARLRVLETFRKKMVEGGYLLLGHSESLVNLSTDFELVTLKNDMVYRKPRLRDFGETSQ